MAWVGLTGSSFYAGAERECIAHLHRVVKPNTAFCGKVPDGVGAFYRNANSGRKPLTKTLGK